MRNKVSPGEYLAFLSMKYEVDPDKLFSAMVSAEENHRSMCGTLSIEFRDNMSNRNVLLITKGSKVVAQFPVPKSFLLEGRNPIKDARVTTMIRRHLIKKNIEPRYRLIQDLRTGMRNISLRAKVLEVAESTLVLTRFGNYASVANALIADETGKIKLCLWNEQITSISKGDTIQIENARMSIYRGEKQLRIGKKGNLSNAAYLAAQPKEVQTSQSVA